MPKERVIDILKQLDCCTLVNILKSSALENPNSCAKATLLNLCDQLKIDTDTDLNGLFNGLYEFHKNAKNVFISRAHEFEKELSLVHKEITSYAEKPEKIDNNSLKFAIIFFVHCWMSLVYLGWMGHTYLLLLGNTFLVNAINIGSPLVIMLTTIWVMKKARWL